MRLNWPEFLKRRNAFTDAQKPPNLQFEIRLGAEAQALYESPAYQRAMERIRMQIHEGWAASPVDDRDGQQVLRLTLKLLDALESQIKEESDTGKLAKRQAELEQRRKAA